MLQANLTIAANGRLVIPASMRAELGLQSGDTLVARLIDGTVILEPLDRAIRRAQAMVRRYIPVETTDIVDELIAERRTDAARE